MENITGQDILDRYDAVRSLLDPKNDKHFDLISSRLVEHADSLEELNDEQRANLKKLFWDLKGYHA